MATKGEMGGGEKEEEVLILPRPSLSLSNSWPIKVVREHLKTLPPSKFTEVQLVSLNKFYISDIVLLIIKVPKKFNKNVIEEFAKQEHRHFLIFYDNGLSLLFPPSL